MSISEYVITFGRVSALNKYGHKKLAQNLQEAETFLKGVTTNIKFENRPEDEQLKLNWCHSISMNADNVIHNIIMSELEE